MPARGWRTAGVCLAFIGIAAIHPIAQHGPLRVGAPAPSFEVADDTGRVRRLAEFSGKTVVLEWHEKGCPYVTKHYRSQQMQALQRKWTGQGVVWLMITSSAEGFHSYLTPEASRAYLQQLGAHPTAHLLDTSGRMGQRYVVTTALHMVIVDPAGLVRYSGAIDDQPKTEASSLAGARNHVDAALSELAAGRAVSLPSTIPYGCEVHYR